MVNAQLETKSCETFAAVQLLLGSSSPHHDSRKLGFNSNLHRRPLSLHTVSFGPHNEVLRRMAQIANEVESRAPQDPMHPLVPSQYAEAIDTVRAYIFYSFAELTCQIRFGLLILSSPWPTP